MPRIISLPETSELFISSRKYKNTSCTVVENQTCKGDALDGVLQVILKGEKKYAGYTIVETGTTYGVALYDHIALDGSSIVENQTITK